MTRTPIRALGLVALVGSVPLYAAEDPGIALPPVPRAMLVAARGGSGAIRRVASASDTAEAGAAALELGPKTITVSPGTTAIVEIAIDHLNRIVTPFAALRVRTVSQATTQVEGNAVYVATPNEDPMSLYLSDANDGETALSLTLAPRRVPPREVRLVLAGGGFVRTALAAAAAKDGGERDQPYVEHIAAAFRALAQNRIPSGYGLRPAGRGEQVTCTQAGAAVTRGQVLEGQRLRLLTARVRNRGSARLDLEERACTAATGEAVAAVAAWPRVWLAPGEETEIYLAVRPREHERERRDRPSLLGTGR